MSNCGSNYIFYTAMYNNKCVGKYKMNMAYNTLIELAQLVGKKIYKLYKPKNFTFDLQDVQQNIIYRYNIDLKYYTFLEYGDYRIGHDKDPHGCDTYHPDIILPVLQETIYPDMIVPKLPYWAGDKVEGLYRDDVFNYIHGKWY
jgi:hypothetical protein